MYVKRILYSLYRKFTSIRAQVCLLCMLIPALFVAVRFDKNIDDDKTDNVLSSEQFSDNQRQPKKQSTKPRCGDVLYLEPFPKENPDKNRQIFYVETTLQPNFNGRLVCSIESAIDVGKLPVKYILLNTTLKLENPNLCDLVDKHYPDKLQFYTTNLEDLFSGTPMTSILNRLDTENKRTKMHLSDLMRYALLYKYGGFFMDRDVLTLRTLVNYKNVLTIEYPQRNPNESCDRNVTEYSKLVNGGAMHFEAGSAFMMEAMRFANETYKHGMIWITMGPPVLHGASNRFLGQKSGAMSHTISTPELTILPSSEFLSIIPGSMPRIFGVNQETSYFYNYTRCSIIIHMCGPESKKHKVSGNPKRDMYSFLGPQVCPLAFSKLDTF